MPAAILRLIPSTHLGRLMTQPSSTSHKSINCPAAILMTSLIWFVAWLGSFHHQLAIKEQTRWCLISAYSVFTTHQVCFVHQLLAYHKYCDILWYNWLIIRTVIYCACDVSFHNHESLKSCKTSSVQLNSWQDYVWLQLPYSPGLIQ